MPRAATINNVVDPLIVEDPLIHPPSRIAVTTSAIALMTLSVPMDQTIHILPSVQMVPVALITPVITPAEAVMIVADPSILVAVAVTVLARALAETPVTLRRRTRSIIF
jgi:hypothetical protein